MSDFKTSLDEYTKEEIGVNGNAIYGGKRHDEIIDYLAKNYSFREEILNDISMGVWLAIESERRVQEDKYEKLRMFCGDYQLFTHAHLVGRHSIYSTFQDLRKAVYTYAIGRGERPIYGDESYFDEDFLGLGDKLFQEKMELMDIVNKQQKKIEKLTDCAKFYANTSNWQDLNERTAPNNETNIIGDSEEIDIDAFFDACFVGGKLARQTLKDIENES